MLNLAVNGYTANQVIDQLHGRNGSRGIVKFRYNILNRYDIIDTTKIIDVERGAISMHSLSDIKRTATFSIKEAQNIDWSNDKIQPVFCLGMQDGGFAEWPLGIFLMSSPKRKDENNLIKRDIEAYDQSLIIKEDAFDDRYRIAAGTKYTSAITTILSGAGIWKINIVDHSGTLSADIEFEIGTTKLQAINKLLAAINYTSIWVDENGFFIAQPYLLPSEKDYEYEYRNNELSVIHTGSTEELDLFSVPNKWVRHLSNPDVATLRSVYTNDLSSSPTSTVNRGRTIVDIESVNDMLDQTTLDAYTQRQAYEASQIYGKFDFTTALMPHHSYYNCLYIEHTDFDISNKYMESSWEMELEPGGRMTHSCRRVIRI